MAVTFPSGPLVSAQWLAEHQQQVVVLDCSVARTAATNGSTAFASGREIFLQQHLPGAQFADLFEQFSAPHASFLFTAPDARQMSEALQAVGVNQHSLIVTYDQLNGAYAARVWYLLAGVFGWNNVRVLDGGFPAWVQAQGTVEHGPAHAVSRGNIQLGSAQPMLVSTRQVEQQTRFPLVCALRREPFRQAHIPGSINLPYPELLDAAGLIDIGQVKSALHDAQITPPETLLLYCGGGINAAGLALALVASGYPITSLLLYDDSLNGWLSDPSRPVASDPT
ncbi:sulfurtransferase [Pantoea sp. App145]|uniref:sulfurtransferase n=1 Tax=Pantoea sp. App145 TaxID=3071567 RepID=UPI003A80E0AF